MTDAADNPSIAAIAAFHADQESRPADSLPVRPQPRIGLLAEYTVATLVEPLRYFCRHGGIDPQIVALPPYRIENWLLAATTDTDRGDAVVVMTDFEKLAGGGATEPAAEGRREFFDRLRSRLDACEAYRTRTGTDVIMAALFTALSPLSETYAHVPTFGRSSWLLDANAWLLAECRTRAIDVLPVHDVLARWGHERCISRKSYLADDVPFSPEGANRVARALACQLVARCVPRRKLLVVDLDGTLWQGVLGEVGPKGIVYKPDSFAGRVYWQAVTHVKSLADSGIVLAINSKNDHDDVMAILRDPEFPLGVADFAAIRANWLPKDENLRSIADELGLALGSMVMLEDSDAECLWLRTATPEVEVVQVPARLSEYPARLAAITSFDRPVLTEADGRRRIEYQTAARRRELAAQAPSFEGFLQSLHIRLTVRPATPANLVRLSQLFERTTQFNLTGQRFSVGELTRLRGQGTVVLSVSYADCFGPAGIVGGVIMDLHDGTARIDNFVLSCRVLGRCVEHAVLAGLAAVVKPESLVAVELAFEPSPRNAPAAAFLADIGWSPGVKLPIEAVRTPGAIRVDVDS